jgi:poly(3-hydroxybutyrate) depolymerase
MPIGEFGGLPPLVAEGSPALTTPMYWMYEMGHASLNPARAVADATKILFQNPLNPWSHTEFGKSIAAASELFERATRRSRSARSGKSRFAVFCISIAS